jgi:DNA-binding LacI/PurR family transcriptional regulator
MQIESGSSTGYLRGQGKQGGNASRGLKAIIGNESKDEHVRHTSSCPPGDDPMNRVKPYASSTDVARLAGVSQSAVSRTYKQGASVSPETRQKVLEAAEQLGYRPSFIPSIMLNHRSRLVAMVVGGLYNPFYSGVLEYFSECLQAGGWRPLLVHAPSGHSLDEIVPMLAGYRVDAVVSALAVLSPRAAEQLSELRVPVITFNARYSGEWVHSVSCDNYGGARVMAQHMVACGARSFAYIAGPADSLANIERRRGFLAGIAEAGLAPPRELPGNFRYEGGRAAVEQLCHGQGLSKTLPDAIFCANDLLALGAMDALRRGYALRVPQDVMVGGYDDIPEANWESYRLTTLLHDGRQMVEKGIEILRREETGHGDVLNSSIIVQSPLVVRESTP